MNGVVEERTIFLIQSCLMLQALSYSDNISGLVAESGLSPTRKVGSLLVLGKWSRRGQGRLLGHVVRPE